MMTITNRYFYVTLARSVKSLLLRIKFHFWHYWSFKDHNWIFYGAKISYIIYEHSWSWIYLFSTYSNECYIKFDWILTQFYLTNVCDIFLSWDLFLSVFELVLYCFETGLMFVWFNDYTIGTTGPSSMDDLRNRKPSGKLIHDSRRLCMK